MVPPSCVRKKETILQGRNEAPGVVQLAEQATLDLRVVSSSPTLRIEIAWGRGEKKGKKVRNELELGRLGGLVGWASNSRFQFWSRSHGTWDRAPR